MKINNTLFSSQNTSFWRQGVKKREWNLPPSFFENHFLTGALFATTGFDIALAAFFTFVSTGGLRDGEVGPVLRTGTSTCFAILNHF